jgi:hypothetical protein
MHFGLFAINMGLCAQPDVAVRVAQEAEYLYSFLYATLGPLREGFNRQTIKIGIMVDVQKRFYSG